MNALLLAAVLGAGPVSAAGASSPAVVAAKLAKNLPSGSLIVSKGDCLAVRVYTLSPYTHVAAVVVTDGKPFVYDSMNGFGVRRQSLADYLKLQDPVVVHVFRPRKKFSKKRTVALRTYLDKQLGRPYAVKHHLTGKRGKALHCSEYVTEGLLACNILSANNPARVSPASLVEGILKAKSYSSAETVQLKSPAPVKPTADGWCEQLWIDTKFCTINSCRKMRGWFLCQ